MKASNRVAGSFVLKIQSIPKNKSIAIDASEPKTSVRFRAKRTSTTRWRITAYATVKGNARYRSSKTLINDASDHEEAGLIATKSAAVAASAQTNPRTTHLIRWRSSPVAPEYVINTATVPSMKTANTLHHAWLFTIGLRS